MNDIAPCPNCGGICVPAGGQTTWGTKWIECRNARVPGNTCGYHGPFSLGLDGKDGAIALHNRIAMAVREAGELRAEVGAITGRLNEANKERDFLTERMNGLVTSAFAQKDRAEKAEAERDALRALLVEILKGDPFEHDEWFGGCKYCKGKPRGDLYGTRDPAEHDDECPWGRAEKAIASIIQGTP